MLYQPCLQSFILRVMKRDTPVNEAFTASSAQLATSKDVESAQLYGLIALGLGQCQCVGAGACGCVYACVCVVCMYV